MERVLLAAGAGRLSLAVRRARSLVLAYHNVVPAGASPVGDRSLHVAQDAFGQQLDLLRRSHEVVPLDALLDGTAGGRPRAVITFDDAYRGALTVGLAELTARRLPATVFVAPGILGDQVTWWDALADHETGEVDPALRGVALKECRGMARDVRALAARASRVARDMPAWARTAGEDELARAVGAGMTVASHSMSHANLAVLDGASLEEEVKAPMTWLRERFPAAFLPFLAYPYGLTSPAAEAAALRAGCRGAFLVSGGYMPRRDAPAARLPRLNIPSGVSSAGFALRAAGLFTH